MLTDQTIPEEVGVSKRSVTAGTVWPVGAEHGGRTVNQLALATTPLLLLILILLDEEATPTVYQLLGVLRLARGERCSSLLAPNCPVTIRIIPVLYLKR